MSGDNELEVQFDMVTKTLSQYWSENQNFSH